MSKILLDDLASLQNETSATNKINTNSRRIETVLNNTLSRDGTTPNSMLANLDMNNNRILNLPEGTSDYEPLRVIDVSSATITTLAGYVTSATTQATNSATSATASAASATTAATQATNASTSATNAATSATAAASSATAAASSATTAATSAANPSVTFTFDSSTTDADPGAGDFRFNHATPASATAVYFDNVDADGSTVTSWLDSFDDSTSTVKGYLTVRQSGSATTFNLYSVSGSVTDGTGYRKVTITSIASGGGSFTNGSRCAWFFARTGDAGSGSLSGSTGGFDNALLRADGTGGSTLQNSAVIVDDSGNMSAVGTLGCGAITSTGALSIGTSNAATVGSIELGHASDTTISRSSAGVIAVEGVAVYSNIPQNSQSAAYTTVLGDANKHILHPTADNNARTFTIDSNANVAYPIGTTLTFINQINTVTIAITSDTLTLAGTGSTGSRTLAANGMATAVKVTSTLWFINGVGLT